MNVFNQVGFIFLFAPLHHASMKYVMPARQRIGKKTIFNLLGPHTNPCGAPQGLVCGPSRLNIVFLPIRCLAGITYFIDA